MSNQTPKNCISESAFLSPPTSAFKPQSSNQTPFWMTAPNFETINPFASPIRSPNSPVFSSSSSQGSPIRTINKRKETPTINLSNVKWIILIISLIFAYFSTKDIDLILPATCFFIIFLALNYFK